MITETKRILVVDDDTHTNAFIAETLKIENYEVLTAASGEEALEKLASNNVDLILLDLILPGIKGWKLVEEMQKAPKLANIPVMIVSILSPEDTELAKNNPRILGYICKPFDVNYLVKEIKKAFSSS